MVVYLLISPTLLVLAMLAQPEAMVGKSKMEPIAITIVQVADREGFNPLLLAAVIMAETGGRTIVARKRGKGRRGCDVGPAQIHVPGCDKKTVKRLLELEENIKNQVRILKWSRRRCRGKIHIKGCNGTLWGRYNPGSKTWWSKVRHMKRRLTRFINSRSVADVSGT